MIKYNALMVLMVLAIAGHAQQALSLSDAITLCLENNFDIRIERQNVNIAENNNNWGQAGLLPTISFGVNQNNNLSDNVKTASPFQLQDITLSNSINPGVTMDWVLFDGFRVITTRRRLDQLEAESAGNASIVITNALQTVILGYYLATLEQERLQVYERQLALSSDRYVYVKTKQELGSSVTSDVLLEEGNYLSDSVNYVNQELVLRSAVRNLNLVMGVRDVDTEYVFTDDLKEDFPSYELGDLQQKMFDGNVDLKKQYISQSILGSDVDLARADRYPTLTMSAGYSHTRSRVDLSRASFPQSDGSSSPGPEDPLNAITDNYFANFRLSFTLFNGGKINRAIKNSMVREDIGNIRIDQMKTTLDRDLRQAYDRYQVRKQLFDINQRLESSAATNLDITQEKFKGGTINSFDYRVVQNNHLNASIQKLQAIYNLMESKIELMRLTGGLISKHVDQ
ncbi:TolC family protein [Marinoscillum furvescens]|uniref:Outer membrane protein TolC n=1 Tax=Marinoscillum furvescens DSM 4134 TaxID=1122208 RepID=A0A3D9L8J4_MARFU|nr:TolC family protein [Marinoscillum furvescens]REE02160.1 outer membrane protein TolC [Marinoscillum furvescens DSM 4134]